MQGLGDAQGILNGVLILRIHQMQRNVGGLVIRKTDAKLLPEQLQAVFAQRILPRVEGSNLSQQRVLEHGALAQALDGKTDVVGEGQIDAGAEPAAQILGGPVHNAAAQLDLLGRQGGKQIGQAAGFVRRLHAEQLFRLGFIQLIAAAKRKPQPAAHGDHFLAIFVQAGHNVIVDGFQYLHSHVPLAPVKAIKKTIFKTLLRVCGRDAFEYGLACRTVTTHCSCQLNLTNPFTDCQYFSRESNSFLLFAQTFFR